MIDTIHVPAARQSKGSLLFVHGAWHAAWCWHDHFMPWFAAQGYDCTALSLRGHGASPAGKSLRRVSINDYVEDLASVVEEQPAPPVLVGHSMGGLVVQRYLERATLPGAVLLASDPVGGAKGATWRVVRKHPLSFLKANLTMRLWPIVASPDLARDMFFSESMPDEELGRHHGRLQDESYRAYLDMLFFRFPRPGRVDTPMLVIGAADDQIFSTKEVSRTAAAYGVEPVIIPDLAHDVMLDVNWVRCAEVVARWLAERG